MSTSTETLERLLVEDLEGLGERLADDGRLSTDLYGALAGFALHKRGEDGRLTLSWSRAEEVLNAASAARGLPPLEGLAQSGREGELSDRAREALQSIGWDVRPRVTDRDDPSHVGRPTSAPPGDTGERRAPVDDPGGWERDAHDAAEAERHRQRTGETRRKLHERHG